MKLGCLKSLVFSLAMMLMFWFGSIVMLSNSNRRINSLNWSIQNIRQHCRIFETKVKSFTTEMNKKLELDDIVVDCPVAFDQCVYHIRQHLRSLQFFVHPKLLFFVILAITVLIGFIMPTVAFTGCCDGMKKINFFCVFCFPCLH